MKILFKNAQILTQRNDKVIPGEILVEGNKIARIAKKINVKADKIIDCDNNLIMPGFKNAHAHSAMVFLRGTAEGFELNDWLNKIVFPREAKLKKNDVYHLSKLAYLEYIQSGITANFDMYYNINEIKKASEDIGMRTAIVLIPRNSSINEIKKDYELNHYNGLVTMELGFHADYTMSEKDLRMVSKVAKTLKAPLYTHCAETINEVNNRKKISHLTPVEYLNKLGIFDNGGAIFHGVHLSKNDIKILKEKNISVISCPTSNLKLCSGIAPIKELTKNKINVGIGTDGAASNNALDMIKEMQTLTLLSKYRENDPCSLKEIDVLKMATINNAHAMNLKKCDTLKEGNLADLIMIDLHAPNMQPNINIINNLVYSLNKSNILLTMIDGRILYYKNKFYLKEDIKKIYQNANKVINRLTR